MNLGPSTQMREENATPGPKCKEYARVFNAMRTLDPILEAHGGSHPPSFQADIGPLSKIPSDFQGLHSLFLHILCSICHCPGFFRQLELFLAGCGCFGCHHRCRSQVFISPCFFAERRQNLTNFVTQFERNEFSTLIWIPAPVFHRDEVDSAGMTNTKNTGASASKGIRQDMESGAALKRI